MKPLAGLCVLQERLQSRLVAAIELKSRLKSLLRWLMQGSKSRILFSLLCVPAVIRFTKQYLNRSLS